MLISHILWKYLCLRGDCKPFVFDGNDQFLSGQQS